VSIQIPEWDGKAKEAGEIWRLRKGKKEAVCTLWTHQMGGQARVTVGRELWRYEALVDTEALVDLAMEWKWQFEEKGWKADVGGTAGQPEKPSA
jgi:hypothetical protein